MNITSKTNYAILTALLFTFLSYGQRNKNQIPIPKPFTERHWAPVTKNVEFAKYKSTDVARSADDQPFAVMLKNIDFASGTIEFDVELKGQGFPSINFRASKDTLNSEIFYLRHFGKPNPMLRTTMQYAAVIDGVNLWDVTDDYQAASTLYEDKWNHIKLVVMGKRLTVFVNDMDRPALLVPAMEGVTDSGTIGLSGNVIYANFKITPNETEAQPDSVAYDPTYGDPYYLRKWQVTQPMDFPFGKDVLQGIQRNPGVAIDPVYLDSTATWTPISAGRRALVNLTKEFGGTKSGDRRLTWLKTTITSEKEQQKLLKLGFSDEVWVFINGKPLFQDKNYYGSPGMKYPVGRTTLDNASFDVPLQEGENEILIGLANYFYGWGIIARFEDAVGIQFD